MPPRTRSTDEAAATALIDALRAPRAYPHPVDEIALITTHISWVLLTGTYAYKLKRPVDLGFVDFSTLARRKHFCAEELRLNRRLAPALYLGVVPITGSPSQPQLGGAGEPVEWAVKMRQFPGDAQFDRLLAEHRLGTADMDALAEVITHFHAGLPGEPAGGLGAPETILAEARDNFTVIAPRLDSDELTTLLHEVQHWQRALEPQLASRLAQRRADGFVRECHGDLHLSNIVRLEGEILPFDCIEFDPALRWIDVIDEIAFTMMDLLVRARPDLAHRLVNSALSISGDYAGLELARFYMVYRSLVRAKVSALQLDEADAPDARERLAARVDAHIRLAAGLVRPRAALLVLMHGLSASGKSVVAAGLADTLPAIRIRSDVERKRLAGLGPLADSGSAPSAGLYDAPMTERVYERLAEIASGVAGAGFDVIVDAAFLREAQRQRLRAVAARHGIGCVIVSCTAPVDELERRITSRKQGGGDASEADTAVLRLQRESSEALSDDERACSITVDTTLAADTAALASALARHRTPR